MPEPNRCPECGNPLVAPDDPCKRCGLLPGRQPDPRRAPPPPRPGGHPDQGREHGPL